MEDMQALLSLGTRPRLTISRHDSPGEERHIKGGVARTVHVVVKNTVLPLHLALSGVPSPAVNFNSFSVDVSLLYDTDGPREKEVDFLKVKPLSFKYAVADGGAKAVVELKIKCLTSQHEDSFFRAKLTALDPRTGREFVPSLYALSEPIKVISKPEQLKKRKIAKKRTLTDMLVETVARIERQQQTQAALIERLADAAARPAAASASHHELPSPLQSRPSPLDHAPPAGAQATGGGGAQTVEFEVAFSQFLASYHSLPSEERAEKVRRLVRGGSSRDTEKLSELIDLFTTEGLNQPPPGADLSAGSSCQCAACPHRAELAKIDDFYKEFLSSPLLGDAMPPHLANFR